MEHRKANRVPIETGVRYKLRDAARLGQTGHGKTVNISSSGISFTTESYLPLGERAELSVDWPVQLNELCGLKLVAIGKVVRASRESAVIRIDKYDFRTRAVAGLVAPAKV